MKGAWQVVAHDSLDTHYHNKLFIIRDLVKLDSWEDHLADTG